MTNPNPLDRIRTLAPADMTDDELGVAMWISSGQCLIADGRYPHLHSLEVRKIYLNRMGNPSGGYLVVGELENSNRRLAKCNEPNPALSYDALLPIVREWWRSISMHGTSHETNQIIFNSEVTWLVADEGGEVGINIELTPRQLAEAFVTAARSVQ